MSSKEIAATGHLIAGDTCWKRILSKCVSLFPHFYACSIAGVPHGRTENQGWESCQDPGYRETRVQVTDFKRRRFDGGDEHKTDIHMMELFARLPGTWRWMVGLVLVLKAVAAPDFTLTIEPPSLTLVPGRQSSLLISMTPLDGFSNQVALTTSPLPTGITAQFSQQNLQPQIGRAHV